MDCGRLQQKHVAFNVTDVGGGFTSMVRDTGSGRNNDVITCNRTGWDLSGTLKNMPSVRYAACCSNEQSSSVTNGDSMQTSMGHAMALLPRPTARTQPKG